MRTGPLGWAFSLCLQKEGGVSCVRGTPAAPAGALHEAVTSPVSTSDSQGI